jgi:hypothetical protein
MWHLSPTSNASSTAAILAISQKWAFPAPFFCDGSYVDYHRPTGTREKIDFREMRALNRVHFARGLRL